MILNNDLEGFSLKRCEEESLISIFLQNEVNRPIAEAADSIEENDRLLLHFVESKLMLSFLECSGFAALCIQFLTENVATPPCRRRTANSEQRTANSEQRTANKAMLCICNARMILSDRIVDRGWLLIADELIQAIGEGVPPDAHDRLDANGSYLAPGFIDLHVHGGGGSDFLDATVEAFLTAADFHLSGGTTSICPTAATTTYDHFDSFLSAWEIAKRSAKARLLPVHLEGPHLARTKAGAQNPKFMSPPGAKERDWILPRARSISQMTIAPELPGALELIETAARAGVTMSAGHTEATDADMRAAVAVGLRKVTHLFNAMSTASKRGLFRPGRHTGVRVSRRKHLLRASR